MRKIIIKSEKEDCKMISDTIKQIRRTHYLSQTEFANRIGVTQGTISQWENGLTRPNLDQLLSISSAFNVSVTEIVNDQSGPVRDFDAINIKRAAVPILGTIACGQRITPDTTPEGRADLPEGVRADFALRCKGDSMEPTLKDGDIILIRKQPEVENGQIAAVNINGETTLKRVYVRGDGLHLIADNPGYQPIFIPAYSDEEIIIHGLAVGYTRLFD
jgi:repressor LexA